VIQLLDVDKVEDVDLVVYQQDPFLLASAKGRLVPLKAGKGRPGSATEGCSD
jgi:hypothetical protein